jgi:hypothetical protein
MIDITKWPDEVDDQIGEIEKELKRIDLAARTETWVEKFEKEVGHENKVKAFHTRALDILRQAGLEDVDTERDLLIVITDAFTGGEHFAFDSIRRRLEIVEQKGANFYEWNGHAWPIPEGRDKPETWARCVQCGTAFGLAQGPCSGPVERKE